MTARRIAYIRTSPADGADDLAQLAWAQSDMTFTDELVSPRDHRRPQRKKALAELRCGDTLVVQSMERIARTPDELSDLLTNLSERGISVEFVTEALTFEPGASLVLQRELALLKAGQTFVRAGDAERQRVGIKKATAKPRSYNGAPLKLSHRKLVELRFRLQRLSRNPEDNMSKVAASFDISRQTLYRYARVIDSLIVAASVKKRARGQRQHGREDAAIKSEKDSIVKRRAAFVEATTVPLAEARARLVSTSTESETSDD